MGRVVQPLSLYLAEVGIDDVLVADTFKLEGIEESNFCLALNNGCICCSVRDDLANAITGLIERHRGGNKIDGILIETTGMADPSPIVQTFFANTYLKQAAYLDGIITVVDAKHIETHLKNKTGQT